jgi:hypothetical protein
MHHARHYDSAWLCQCLQPRGHIHAIAIDIALLDDHVTQVYPDAKSEPPILRLPDVIPCYLRLKVQSTFRRFYSARKLSKKAIACTLHDASAVFSYGGLNHARHKRYEPGVRPFFVRVHQPRIAGYVSGENGSETADHRGTPDSRATPCPELCPATLHYDVIGLNTRLFEQKSLVVLSLPSLARLAGPAIWRRLQRHPLMLTASA